MSEDAIASNEKPANEPAPTGTVDNPSTDAPPQRGIPKERLDAVLAQKRELESRLKQLEDAAAERARKEAEEQGRWQDLAKQHEDRATQLAGQIESMQRRVALADAGINDPDLREFAEVRYAKHGDGKDFGEFLQAELKSGALAKFLQPSEPEQPADDRPKGTRTSGKTSPEIPQACRDEADQHGMDHEKWYRTVWLPRSNGWKRT